MLFICFAFVCRIAQCHLYEMKSAQIHVFIAHILRIGFPMFFFGFSPRPKIFGFSHLQVDTKKEKSEKPIKYVPVILEKAKQVFETPQAKKSKASPPASVAGSLPSTRSQKAKVQELQEMLEKSEEEQEEDSDVDPNESSSEEEGSLEAAEEKQPEDEVMEESQEDSEVSGEESECEDEAEEGSVEAEESQSEESSEAEPAEAHALVEVTKNTTDGGPPGAKLRNSTSQNDLANCFVLGVLN